MRWLWFTAAEGKRQLVLAGVALLLGAGQVWLWPQVQGAVVQWHRAQSHEEQLAVVAARTAELQAMMTEERQRLEQLALVAPGPDQVPQLVDRLERLGEQYRAAVRISTITETPIPDGPIRLQVKVLATGAPGALLSYFDAVERLQELAIVEGWELAPRKVSNAGGSASIPSREEYILEMTINFYLQGNVPDGGA